MKIREIDFSVKQICC